MSPGSRHPGEVRVARGRGLRVADFDRGRGPRGSRVAGQRSRAIPPTLEFSAFQPTLDSESRPWSHSDGGLTCNKLAKNRTSDTYPGSGRLLAHPDSVR